MIELCKHYMTTGFPRFRPVCLKLHLACRECHSKNGCIDYEPSPEGYYPDKRGKESKENDRREE